MLFKKKSSEEIAKELKELKRKRYAEEGRAKLLKLREEEMSRIRAAKGESGFAKGIKNIGTGIVKGAAKIADSYDPSYNRSLIGNNNPFIRDDRKDKKRGLY